MGNLREYVLETEMNVLKLWKCNCDEFLPLIQFGVFPLYEVKDSSIYVCINYLHCIFQILKQGLNDPKNGPKTLKCLSVLCKIVFSEVSKDCILSPSLLYQMLRSHSQYISIMLNCEENMEDLKGTYELNFLKFCFFIYIDSLN